jgi:CheY-like chemotaxis protein
MGGLAVYAQLRLSRPQLIPAFALITGDIFDVRLKTLVADGDIAVLSKPFSTAKLDAVVDRVLSDRFLTRTGPNLADPVTVTDPAAVYAPTSDD